jgi:IrrE N-terminal-like domain
MRSPITQLRDSVPLRRLSSAEVLRVAEAQASRLLRLSGKTEPPVGEDIIAELPGIEIVRVTPSKVQATVLWSHGRWLILLNAAEPRGRQRLSLAHELKHILDHPFETILYARRDGSSEQVEMVCDYFASCLLMPRLATSDGGRLWAFRYSSERRSRSLDYSTEPCSPFASCTLRSLRFRRCRRRPVWLSPNLLAACPAPGTRCPSQAGVIRVGADELDDFLPRAA